ncbi:testis-expressed protein 9-like [Pollicipes pollicipes]|uniref:testis-expressed protein 9-like n=1 Tax=Pollicipes pollicipes TaxID=41117 RepID=UPI001884AB3D|nr:testis-expressed protein 9-like [Pollicipes pollicipes]XP_037080196.1 testis-expressed protein 9-like [Pollicipes pollicipes]XP_037080197.1 testis-expressed protein 9-like [Pollicipes pollicipes]XP_037080198.1 testis-expressed protein 9-like [Pollicipes pollicipes]
MDNLDDVSLREKEEYYRKLNESLKKKTASLISQAESALREKSEAAISFDIPREQNEGQRCPRRRNDACMKSKEVLGSSQAPISNTLGSSQEPYQVTLDQTIPPSLSRECSDSEDSITEEFDQLSTKEDECSSASSVVSKNLSRSAQTRLYQAKLRVSKAEIKRLKAQCEKLARENSALAEKSKASEKEQQRAVAGSQKYNLEINRLKKAFDEAKKESQTVKNECVSWKKDAENSNREVQTVLNSSAQMEVKLRRANEEVEKLRLALETEKGKTKDLTETSKDRILSLEAMNKKLEKQKQELITGFKKQMKLIDVLKRQKLHLEGAKLLQISEEEFLKVIDLNLGE